MPQVWMLQHSTPLGGPCWLQQARGAWGKIVWHSMSCCSLLSRASCLQDSMPSIQTFRLFILQPFKSVA